MMKVLETCTTLPGMAMGKRSRERQPTMWVPTTELPTSASHPFYARLNALLSDRGFDDFAEARCAAFYAATMGRPGLAPAIYFRDALAYPELSPWPEDEWAAGPLGPVYRRERAAIT